MKTVGFPISRKENEKRRAIVPQDISKIRHPELLFFETGYGAVLGISDEDYIKAGANITSCEEVLKKDIICDPKIKIKQRESLIRYLTPEEILIT